MYELFVYFGYQPLFSCIVCSNFLLFCMLSFYFVDHFLCFGKASKFDLGPICLLLLLFILSWETDLRKYCYNLCQRMFCLYSLLGVLWYDVLLLGLQTILSLFLYMMWRNVLISLFYMRLSKFPNTTCWRDYLFSIVYSCLFFHRLFDRRCVGFFLGPLFRSIDLCICFHVSTALFWLL